MFKPQQEIEAEGGRGHVCVGALFHETTQEFNSRILTMTYTQQIHTGLITYTYVVGWDCPGLLHVDYIPQIK